MSTDRHGLAENPGIPYSAIRIPQSAFRNLRSAFISVHQRLKSLTLLFLLAAGAVYAQGEIKFSFQGRYDTVLTASDTALVKMTIIEFHRKLARAGYATYYYRSPGILSCYVTVQAESIEAIGDSLRLIVLDEIQQEIDLTQNPATFDRIRVRSIEFPTDTIARVYAVTPFQAYTDTIETAERYDLHLDRTLRQWWIHSTGPDEALLVYRNYLTFPDEIVEPFQR